MGKVVYCLTAFIVGTVIFCASVAAVVWLAINPWRILAVVFIAVAGFLALFFVCLLIGAALDIGEFVLREAGWRKP